MHHQVLTIIIVLDNIFKKTRIPLGYHHFHSNDSISGKKTKLSIIPCNISGDKVVENYFENNKKILKKYSGLENGKIIIVPIEDFNEDYHVINSITWNKDLRVFDMESNNIKYVFNPFKSDLYVGKDKLKVEEYLDNDNRIDFLIIKQ